MQPHRPSHSLHATLPILQSCAATLLLAVIGISGCKKHEAEPVVAKAVAATPIDAAVPPVAQNDQGNPMEKELVQFLIPEAIVAQRVSSVDALAGSLKLVSQQLETFAVTSPQRVPDYVTIFWVARKGAMRAWFVGPDGDLQLPEVAASIAALPAPDVHDGDVIIAISLKRAKAPATPPISKIPAAWLAFVGSKGASMEDVVRKVWPVE